MRSVLTIGGGSRRNPQRPRPRLQRKPAKHIVSLPSAMRTSLSSSTQFQRGRLILRQPARRGAGPLSRGRSGNLGNDVQRAPEGQRVNDRPAFILGIDAEAQVDNCVADISRDQIARRKENCRSTRLDVGEFQPSGSSVSSTEGRRSLSRREPKNPCRR